MTDPVTTNYSWTKPTVGADADTWGALLNTDLDGVDTVVAGIAQALLPRPVLSTAGASATFAVAAGTVVDSATFYPMTLAASISKTTSAWTVGTGNGALDTGAIANSTWYHAYLIRRTDTGVVDVLVSLSATAPTMPSGYTQKRRIGAMRTDSSGKWTAFTQTRDEFLLSTPVMVNGTLPSGPTAVTLRVPTGVKVNALFKWLVQATDVNQGWLAYPVDMGTQAPNIPVGFNDIWANTLNEFKATSGNVRTDTSAQINVVGPATAPYWLATYGWIDPL